MVSDLDDPRIVDYRALSDPATLTRRRLFVAEGRFVVQRLLAASRFPPQSILVTAVALEALQSTGALDGRDVPVYVVGQAAMNALVGFNIHRGCLALGQRAPRSELALPDVGSRRRILILDGVNNPDNIGGLFRSAAALGVDAVVLGPGCSDPLYRKAIRTSMAATLQLPFLVVDDWPAALQALRAGGLTLIALTPRADATPLDQLGPTPERLAILVGAEGEGLSETALTEADARVAIPMHAAVDSLNVTVAASIALYALR